MRDDSAQEHAPVDARDASGQGQGVSVEERRVAALERIADAVEELGKILEWEVLNIRTARHASARHDVE